MADKSKKETAAEKRERMNEKIRRINAMSKEAGKSFVRKQTAKKPKKKPDPQKLESKKPRGVTVANAPRPKRKIRRTADTVRQPERSRAVAAGENKDSTPKPRRKPRIEMASDTVRQRKRSRPVGRG